MPTYGPAECVPPAHAAGCEHLRQQQMGVVRFLAHPRTRDVLALGLANLPVPMIDPHASATALLHELARAQDYIDGLDANVEVLEPEDADALVSWLFESVGA